MTNTHRIEFFRNALEICARHGRSPRAAFVTAGGEAYTVRQLLKTSGAGQRLPSITETEARRLAREYGFSFNEILIGLSARPRRTRQPRGRATRARRSQ